MTWRLRAVAPWLAALGLLGLAAPAGADPAATGDGSSARHEPATMSAVPGEPVQLDERPRPTLAPDTRGRDRNTAYLGAAAVVLGAMVWWNRRRRERFEREDRGAVAARSARDDDADELHAAAGRTGDEDSSARPEAAQADRARETR